MTNVVETCLSFMRSSFRMSKHKETSTNRVHDDVTSRGSFRTQSAERVAEKNMQQKPSISNNTSSTSLLRSTSKSPSKQVSYKLLVMSYFVCF